MRERTVVICNVVLIIYVCAVHTHTMDEERSSWKHKDIRDMNDADLERLLDQWEANDEPLEPDELPEHLRPSPKIDISKLDTSNPDNLLKVTKRGKGVMMFVDTNEDLTEEYAQAIMKIWQTSLQNNHIIAERYPIDPRRSVFLFREGSQVVDAKNFLLEQPDLSHISLEGQIFYRDPDEQEEHIAKMREQVEGRKTKEKRKNTEL